MKARPLSSIDVETCLHMVMAIPSNATFSAGDTWFDKLNKSFVHVVVGDEDEIPTTDFLEAATALTTLFGMLKILSIAQ